MSNYPASGSPTQYYPPPPPRQGGVSTGVKIGIGIVVGVLLTMGGCVACGVFLIGNTARQVQQTQQERERESEAGQKLLQFEDVKDSTQYSHTTITGRVRNNGSVTFEWVKVGVDWKDKGGRIVDSGYTYLVAGEALRPGAAKTFQIMSRKDDRAVEYSVAIIEAR